MKIYDVTLKSNIILGSSRYPSPKVFQNCIKKSGTNMVTVAIRRLVPGSEDFLKIIKKTKCHILPNTAGCFSPKEAIVTAEMARELFETNLIKLEVIEDDSTLKPSMKGTIKATEKLMDKGFKVLPYITDNIKFATTMKSLGCKVIMPWGSHIGSGRGLDNFSKLKTIREELLDTTLIVDAGIGRVSHVCQIIELGFDGILLNSAVVNSKSPEKFAESLALGMKAVQNSVKAGLMTQRTFATASTSNKGKPFSK
ncbi:MAG TPA: thiazole synthase [Candidatus Dadabacteria bacterium]|nr:thiazole synthase [Candidatus Dadabacteria bacterium]